MKKAKTSIDFSKDKIIIFDEEVPVKFYTSGHYFITVGKINKAALQIRAGQRWITVNLWPLTTHAMIIVTSDFSKNFFFINIFIFQKFFWTIFNLFSWNLNTITKHNEQVCFLCICSFFTHCFVIILCINVLHHFILSHCRLTTHRMTLFSFCLLFCNHSM